MPSNVGGFGEEEKEANFFVRNELITLKKQITELKNRVEDDVTCSNIIGWNKIIKDAKRLLLFF